MPTRHITDDDKYARRLAAIFAILPAGLIILDGDGYVQDCNAFAESLLGEPLQDELWVSVIQRAFSPRSDDGHEVSLYNGKRLGIATTPLEIEPGQLILLYDLTETRELQDRLSHYKRLSQMGKMVASVAHQIRTPLSSAIIYASHLSNAETLTPQQYYDFPRHILARLHNIELQIRDMLLFAQGGGSIIEPVSIRDLVHELLQRVNEQVALHGSVLSVCPVIENAILYCNSASILGALQNLVNNAMESSTDKLRLQLNVDIIDYKKVRITLQDNGPGISDAIKQKLFEPFFTTKTHGTGLGLAVVYAVVQAHQGEIIFKSIVGQGTEAGFILPLQLNSVTEACGSPELGLVDGGK